MIQPAFSSHPTLPPQVESLSWPKQQRIAPPRLDLSSLCSPVPAARRSTQDFPVSPTAPVHASAESHRDTQQQDATCTNRHAGSDSDQSNDSFELFGPFKSPAPAAAAAGEVETLGAAPASKGDSDEGETATVQDCTESNSHDSDENDAGNGSDEPPDHAARHTATPFT
jgi:hypothetical protein